MSSKPLPSVSSRVDASSVQSQFATITQSRDALRLELQQLETEIRRTQNSMATLKETSLENSQKLTVLHESLGKHRMKKQLFQQEQSRLEQLLLQERQQLQQITDSIKQLEHDSKQNKQHFASQLQLLSNDMQDLIQKHEDAKWCAYLEHGEDAVQILHKFASTEEHASMLANIPIDWLTSIQTLQSHCNLQQDMMVELEALREQAKALEPVRIAAYKCL
jgi:chromosome segregation ATPase